MGKKLTNNSLLLKLYYGQLEPNSSTNALYEDYYKMRMDYSEKLETLLKNNSEALNYFNKIQKLYDLSELEIADIQLAEGFRLGLLLALEVLGFIPPEMLTEEKKELRL